jgi:hypothetical protein
MKLNVENDFFNAGISVSRIDDTNVEKKKIECINELNSLKLYDVKSFTLYKKWQEIKAQKPNPVLESFAKDMIWKPLNLDDEELTINQINLLEPAIVFVDEEVNDLKLNVSDLENLWTSLRIFGSTAEYNQAPGRFIKFFIIDKTSKKILGISSIASDVISISDRDEFIGWTQENKLDGRMLKHSAIGTTIVPTQPFGYNFLGGKLVACMVTSDKVRNKWKSLYGDTLVGMTTTSLYGSYSMYNSLKWWKFVGKSEGKILIKPEESIYKQYHDYIKEKYPEKYKKAMTQKEGISGPVTGAKNRVLSMIFQELGIKISDYYHNFCRGVYYSCFYENTKEFLGKKIKETELKMKPLFKGDVNSIMEYWRPKAIERYKNLKLKSSLNNKILFHNNLRNIISFDDVKVKCGLSE